MSDLMPCPFCGGELLAWGASAFRHPSGKCILSDRVFDRRFRGQWNTRTEQAQVDAAVAAERERWEAMSQINFANQSTARSIRSIDAMIRKGDQP